MIVTDKATNDVFRCKVVEMDSEYVYVDYPINMDTNTIGEFVSGIELTLRYVKNNIVFKFDSHIAKRTSRQIPVLAVPLPEESAIERIQRREFVRVDAIIDISVHSTSNAFAPFTSITKDISGGGVSIVIPPKIEVNIDENVKLFYVLKSDNSGYNYLESEAKVVSKRREDDVETMSVEFIGTDERVQQKIILYCFDKQRQERINKLS